MIKSLESLEPDNNFFEGLDYYNSVALEDFNAIEIERAFKVDKLVQKINKQGMSKQLYVALEELSPGIMSLVDYKRLTTNHSKTCAVLALESVSGSGFFDKFGSGGIGAFFIAFYDWIVAKITGHSAFGIHGRLHESWVKARRRLVTLHEMEKEVTDTLVRYKTDQVLTPLLKDIGKALIKSGEYNANDIISAMVDMANRCSAAAIPGMISLAKLCITNNCPVSDFRTVANRLIKHKNILSNPAQTAGLAATRVALPASLLIGREVGVDSGLGTELVKLSDQYIQMAKMIARAPMGESSVEGWLKQCESQVEVYNNKLEYARSVIKLKNRWTTDSEFSAKLYNLEHGTIGFWYDTQSRLQGETVYNPDDCADILRSAFEMNRSGDLDSFAKAVETAMENLQSAVSLMKNLDQNRIEKLIGNYNSNSARLRNVIKSFRNDATVMLRISRILESYVRGYIRAFKSVKSFTGTYKSAVDLIYSTPIK